MKFRTIASMAAILTLINATFYLFAPAFSLALLGSETNLAGILNTRISGACAVGLGVITWLAREIRTPAVCRLISIGMLSTFSILVVIDFQGILSGAINMLGWLILVADLFLAIGFLLTIFTDGGRQE
jgi:hypothetical protein